MAAIAVCWLGLAFIHLYFFSYASMDSWCYAAPALVARSPFQLSMPFLGTFEGLDKGWGLHWPGGPLLTSIFAPVLPHHPGVYILVYLCYWLLACLAAAALARRLTGSSWMGLAAFCLVAGDQICFIITWLQRYEMLDGAIAMVTIMALVPRRWQPDERRWSFIFVGPGLSRRARIKITLTGLRSFIIGAGFFLFPLLHPVFTGLGGGLLVYLGLSTFALGRPWRNFIIAAVAYAAGWGGFLSYYWSRPWLYAVFLGHAHQGALLSHEHGYPSVHMFLVTLFSIDKTRSAAIVYLAGVAYAGYLAWVFWKCGKDWRKWMAAHELQIYTALALLGTLALSQFTYNYYYWSTAWPFAATLACDAASRLLRNFPARRRLIAGALAAVVLLHMGYFAGRTYLWYKTGFVNLRGIARDFSATLPREGRLFIPEVLWDSLAWKDREVYMNDLPYIAGDERERRYADYIATLIRPGDVLVIDELQSHVPLIDPHQPGWKEIGHCKAEYMGAGALHGFGLTAYQKL
jgi:hypothetical protein